MIILHKVPQSLPLQRYLQIVTVIVFYITGFVGRPCIEAVAFNHQGHHKAELYQRQGQ